MNKKLVWTIVIAIVIVFLIILAATNKKDQTPDTDNQNELPDTTTGNYNALATSNDDFSALDEALTQIS